MEGAKMRFCWREQAAGFAVKPKASLCLSAKGGLHAAYLCTSDLVSHIQEQTAAPVLPKRQCSLLEMPRQSSSNLLLNSQMEGGEAAQRSYFRTGSAKRRGKVNVSILYLPYSGGANPMQGELQVFLHEGTCQTLRKENCVSLTFLCTSSLGSFSHCHEFLTLGGFLCPSRASWNSADRHPGKVCLIDWFQLNKLPSMFACQ